MGPRMAPNEYIKVLGDMGIEQDTSSQDNAPGLLRLVVGMDCHVSVNGLKQPEPLRKGRAFELPAPAADSFIVFAETLDGLADLMERFGINACKTNNILIRIAALHAAAVNNLSADDPRRKSDVVLTSDADCEVQANGQLLAPLLAGQSITCRLSRGENIITAKTLDGKVQRQEIITLTDDKQLVVHIKLVELLNSVLAEELLQVGETYEQRQRAEERLKHEAEELCRLEKQRLLVAHKLFDDICTLEKEIDAIVVQKVSKSLFPGNVLSDNCGILCSNIVALPINLNFTLTQEDQIGVP